MTAASETPRVSVVVPVRDRRAMLIDLLGALERQTYRDFEVVVVDDGSTDGSGEAAEAASSDGFCVRVVRADGAGAVAARTSGAAAARGSILAFTDSDCIPDPTWLEESVAAFEDGVDLVQGQTTSMGPVRLLERSLWVGHEDGLYATCNILYRREAFERAGGFDDAGRTLGFRLGMFERRLGFGEDALLGWRVRRKGSTVFVPKAIVRHAVTTLSPMESLRRAWMTGGFPSLVGAIPELRNTLLKHRVFLGTRRIPLYATIAAVLLRRTRLAGLTAAWWVGRRTLDAVRVEREPRKLAEGIAFELATDVVIGAALVAGSARAKQVVL